MTVDNSIYDDMAGTWWEPGGFLHALDQLLGPLRLSYFGDVLSSTRGGRVLDLGCGGGLVAEPLAEAGYRVVGLDPSRRSVAVATAHGHGRNRPSYTVGTGERLPFAAGSFDAVVCSEVLEHVPEPALVVAEAARVLRPGGVLLFSCPNRTRLSKLVLIDAAQRWRWTRVLPPRLHAWERFIRPGELASMATAAGLAAVEVVGVGLPLRRGPAAVTALGRLRLGTIDHGTAARHMRLERSRSTALAYMGWARRRQGV